jgi:putative transposase
MDAYRDQFGGERICGFHGVTAGGYMTIRGYRAAKTRPLSYRAICDQFLGEELQRLHTEYCGVY